MTLRPWVALWFALSAQAALAKEIVVSSRSPIAIALVRPTGEQGRLSSPAIAKQLTALFETRTDLEPDYLEPDVVTACKGTLGCIVKSTRGASEGAPAHSMLLIVSNLTARGRKDHLSVTLIDVRSALDVLAKSGGEHAEASIQEQSIWFGPVSADVATEEEGLEFLRSAFTSGFGQVLIKTGHFEPPTSEIELTGAQSGVDLTIDGRKIGKLDPGTNVLRNVTPGRRALSISSELYEPWSVSLDVKPSERAHVQLQLRAREVSEPELWPTLALGGAGLAVAGGALALYAGLSVHPNVVCVSIPPCPSNASPVNDPGFNHRVSPIAVVGLSAASLGLAVALTSWLAKDKASPWLELGAGIAAGALGAGLAAATGLGKDVRSP
jgi:hypothetical protein